VLGLLTGVDCISIQKLIGSGGVWELIPNDAYLNLLKINLSFLFVLVSDDKIVQNSMKRR
jgi:hypothetical protein